MEIAAQPPPLLSDEELQLARSGSAAALGRLLEQCRAYLLKVAGEELDSALLPKAGASDLVQDAYLEAHRIFERFEGHSPEELLAWLRGILKNKLLEHDRRYRQTQKRAAGREVTLDTPPVPASTLSPASGLVRDENAERLNEAIGRLPDHYRQVVVWRYWDDLPFEEIAHRLSKTPEAARMLWLRAIEKLEQDLQ
jgi:RNA polymerase sigma-70 factor (ECF subfamily)